MNGIGNDAMASSLARLVPHTSATEKPMKFKLPFNLPPFALGLILATAAHGANATWNGLGGSTNLGNGANWSSGSATFADGETATWDGIQTGNLALTWTGGLGPGSGNNGGLNLSLTANQTGNLQLDAVSGNLGVGNITIASGAGAFTLGDGAGTSNVVYRTATVFTNNSANTATVKSDVVFLNGGGIGNRAVTLGGTGNWLVEGSLVTSAFGGSETTASLVKNGGGTLTLSGANAHGGGTTLNAGILAVTHGSALGASGTVTIGGTFDTRLELFNNIALAGPANINLSGRNNTADNTSSGAAIRNSSGNNSIASNIVFNNFGGTYVNILSAAGTLTVGGNLTAATVTGSRTFNLNGPGNITLNGNVTNGSAVVGIEKNGAGTLTIAGASNSYTGSTTVNGGTLVVNSTITSAAIVNSGGTIAGTGSALSIDVASGGFLAPGNGIGTLTTTSATLLGLFQAEVSGAGAGSSDRLAVGGAFNIGSGSINFAVLSPLDDAAYVLASYGSLTGSQFASVSNLPTGYKIDYGYNGGTQIALVPVPEPSAVLLGSLGALGLLRRRRA